MLQGRRRIRGNIRTSSSLLDDDTFLYLLRFNLEDDILSSKGRSLDGDSLGAFRLILFDGSKFVWFCDVFRLSHPRLLSSLLFLLEFCCLVGLRLHRLDVCPVVAPFPSPNINSLTQKSSAASVSKARARSRGAAHVDSLPKCSSRKNLRAW